MYEDCHQFGFSYIPLADCFEKLNALCKFLFFLSLKIKFMNFVLTGDM